MTSQAEPRLLSRADSGAVRHSLHLAGEGGGRRREGGHREESGREEGMAGRRGRGGSRDQSQDKTTTAEFTIRIWRDDRRRLGGERVSINDNQDKRG